MRTIRTFRELIFLASIFILQSELQQQSQKFFLCVEPIAAMFNGGCNESANITTIFILAKENHMLEKEKYFA